MSTSNDKDKQMEVEYTAIGESTYKQKDNEVKTYGNFEYVLTGIAVNSGVIAVSGYKYN